MHPTEPVGDVLPDDPLSKVISGVHRKPISRQWGQSLGVKLAGSAGIWGIAVYTHPSQHPCQQTQPRAQGSTPPLAYLIRGITSPVLLTIDGSDLLAAAGTQEVKHWELDMWTCSLCWGWCHQCVYPMSFHHWEIPWSESWYRHFSLEIGLAKLIYEQRPYEEGPEPELRLSWSWV